ncbi:MAG: nuclease-related domain-containing protein [bacterium]|nr:nuclease-related domain-containing protein [bacterium]
MSALFVIIIIIFGVLITLKIFYPKIKGRIGESYIVNELSRLDSARYRVLNDVMLPSLGRTSTTQIDHLVISNYGIFCIETKNYSGWIFGNADGDYWTQVIYRYKEKFYSPIRQNYAHIKAIEAILGLGYEQVPIFSLVVFPSADKLKISGTDTVIFVDELLPAIKSHSSACLSNEKRDAIYNKFLLANVNDKRERKEHIAQVRQSKHFIL